MIDRGCTRCPMGSPPETIAQTMCLASAGAGRPFTCATQLRVAHWKPHAHIVCPNVTERAHRQFVIASRAEVAQFPSDSELVRLFGKVARAEEHIFCTLPGLDLWLSQSHSLNQTTGVWIPVRQIMCSCTRSTTGGLTLT
eukprot:858219-Prymnesium_polylepis.3